MTNSTLIRFGKPVALANGDEPILRDAMDGSAFVEHDKLVAWGVGAEKTEGHACRVWIAAPGWKPAYDRDGAKIGMEYTA